MLNKSVGRADALDMIENLETNNITGLNHVEAVIRLISQAHDHIDNGHDVEYYTGVSERLTEHCDKLADEEYAAGYYYFIQSINQ